MDSITQFTLGAAIGVAVMGRRTAPWKAAVWGGVCGTLPDLDAFIDKVDVVSNMTQHRAETHAIFWQTLASPPIAAALAAFDAGIARFRAAFPYWLLAVWLILVTHSLLDGLTIYGTRLALPFDDRPFGLGSIFIIDPLYTLPLLIGLIVTLRSRRASRHAWNLAAIAISSAYLAWSVAAQRHVSAIVDANLAGQPGPPASHVLVTPAPFNTLLWRVLVMRSEGYDEGFYSLLDKDRRIRFTRFPRDQALYEQARHIPALAEIAWFSRGFYRVDSRDGLIRITDLRMGQEPFYVFTFAVARRASAPQPITPVAVGGRDGLDLGASFRWLLSRTAGNDVDPPRRDHPPATRRHR